MKSSFLLTLTLSLWTALPCWATPLTIENWNQGETLRYPVPLLIGTLDGRETGNEIVVRNTHPADRQGAITGVVHQSRFKVVTELYPGKNHLELRSGTATTTLDLVYEPQTTPYVLRFFYITDNSGDLIYPSPVADDPQNFRAKMDTAAKLMQSFCAESMRRNGYGRKTFNLEYDEDGKLIVHVLKSPKPRSYFQENHAQSWYGHVSQLVNRDFPAGNRGPGRFARNMALINVTDFSEEKGGVVGGVALGAPGLALFGSGALYTWPNTLQDTYRVFSDATPVDPKKEFDDSAGRSARWAIASTSIGACVHEFGHGFGLPHSTNPIGIMSRGFDHFARMFTLVEPPSRKNAEPIVLEESMCARWSPGYAARLRYSPFLALDAPEESDAAKPVITRTPDSDEITVETEEGIAWIGMFDFNQGDLYLNDANALTFEHPFPTQQILSVKQVQADVGVPQISIAAQDRHGNVTYANPKHLTLEFPPEETSLATGKPVTTSGHNEGFDGGKAVDGSLDRESRWDASPYPHWLQVDLEETRTLSRIRIVPYWDGSRYYRYRLEVSRDGNRWKELADMSANTKPATRKGHVHEFPPEEARYIRVTMLENSANIGVHIVELLAYAPE